MRSSAPFAAVSTSGLFPQVCIFCPPNALFIKKKGLNREKPAKCETRDAQDKIKNAASVLHDEQLLAKIEDVEFSC